MVCILLLVMNLQIFEAGNEHRQMITELFAAYAAELQEDLCFQGFSDELNDPFKKYAPPAGRILIAYYDNEPAGCIALLQLASVGVCEMKRLFVRPAYRSLGTGALLVQQLISVAKAVGYKSMVLDTLNRLQPAIRLYERFGFSKTKPYYPNPLPGVVYMQKQLDA